MFLIVIVILLLDFHHVSSLSLQFQMMICQKDDLNDDEYVLVCAYMHYHRLLLCVCHCYFNRYLAFSLCFFYLNDFVWLRVGGVLLLLC